MVPCLQWLDRGSIRNPMETFAPLPIAVALITAIMLINVILKFLTNFNIIPKQSSVIIYIMLSISIPFCSIGLMRGFYWGVSVVSMQYMNWKTNIVKSVYEIQDPSFFPKLSDDDYQDFHSLKEQIENIESENENLKSQLNNLVEPFDKFFFGTYSNDDVNEQFKKTGWDLLDQAIRISSTLPWSIWLSPIKNWIIFFILVFIIALLFTHFFFRDWVEKENLAFPLAQIPLVIIGEKNQSNHDSSKVVSSKTSIISNPSFLFGISIAILILFFGGLTHYRIIFIDMDIAVNFQRIDFNKIFTNDPWSTIKNNLFLFTPLFIGIAILVHQEILKGILIIFFFIQFLTMVSGIFNEQLIQFLGANWGGNKVPFYSEMGTGASIVYAFFIVWLSRKHFSRKISLLPGNYGSYTIALIIILTIWLIFLGLSGFRGIFYYIFVLIWVVLGGISIARIRAETGLHMNSGNFVSHHIGYQTGSVPVHGLNNMALLAQSSIITFSSIPGLIATQLESMFIAKKLKMNQKTVLMALLIGFIVSIFVGLISFLIMSYSYGAFNLLNQHQIHTFLEPFFMLFSKGDLNFSHHLKEIHYSRVLMIFVGGIVMCLLIYARKNYTENSLPPICFLVVCLGIYAMPDSRGALHYADVNYVNIVWGPVLLAYIFKALVLKFGGMDLYKKVYPIAFGLIIGHLLINVLWNVYHWTLNNSSLKIFNGIFSEIL